MGKGLVTWSNVGTKVFWRMRVELSMAMFSSFIMFEDLCKLATILSWWMSSCLGTSMLYSVLEKYTDCRPLSCLLADELDDEFSNMFSL